MNPGLARPAASVMRRGLDQGRQLLACSSGGRRGALVECLCNLSVAILAEPGNVQRVVVLGGELALHAFDDQLVELAGAELVVRAFRIGSGAVAQQEKVSGVAQL